MVSETGCSAAGDTHMTRNGAATGSAVNEEVMAFWLARYGFVDGRN